MSKWIGKILAAGLAATLLLTAAGCAAEEGSTVPADTTQNLTGTSTASASSATGMPSTMALEGKLVASGSTSMEDLMTAFGEAFSVINPKVSVEIQGGGSSTGVKNASEGVTEIGNASRALKDEEKTLGLTEHIVAIDGIAIVVNAKNPVANLTTEQLAAIFTGKATNWKDVGGADAPIVVILREAGSGTRDGFEDLLKIKDQCVGTEEVNETGIVKSKVAGNSNAIGYMSLGKVDSSVKALPVAGIAPTEATVLDKTYILQRPFVCLTKGGESSLVKAFFEFIYSAEGQALVAKKGYVPIK